MVAKVFEKSQHGCQGIRKNVTMKVKPLSFSTWQLWISIVSAATVCCYSNKSLFKFANPKSE